MSSAPVTRWSRPFLLAACLASLVSVPGPVAAAGFQLRVSDRPDRADSVTLAGSRLAGTRYVFTAPDARVSAVAFWLDDAEMTAGAAWIDAVPRYDFRGTYADGTAIGWDTTGVPAGPHTIDARLTTSRGAVDLHAAFTVTAPAGPVIATPGSTAVPSASPTAVPAPTATPGPTASQAPTATPGVSGTIVPATTGALAASIAAASDGATLVLRGGEHVNGLISTGKSLTIRAYPGETPVITNPTSRPDYLYLTGGPVLVSGITFRMGVDAPTFDDSMGSALTEVVSGGHDVTYEQCTFVGNPNASGRQHLLYVAGNTGTVTVRDSVFDYNGGKGSGVHAYHDPGASLTVVGNTFRDFAYEAAVLIDQTGSGKVVSANTFYDSNIAVQHVKSDGTSVTSNTGYRVRTGIDVRSSTNLIVSGNVWNP
jgi:Right handed beta helix region